MMSMTMMGVDGDDGVRCRFATDDDDDRSRSGADDDELRRCVPDDDDDGHDGVAGWVRVAMVCQMMSVR